MRAWWTIWGCLALVAACGDDDVVGRDTGVIRDGGPGVDMGPPDRDLGPPDEDTGPPPPPDVGPPPPPDMGLPDTGPAEPCDRPGASEDVVCGMCGTRTRFCTSALTWEYSPCEGEHGVCMAGTTGTESCGRCGTAEARCTDACVWEIVGDCGGEHGDCDPGDAERTGMGCTMGATRGRACNDACAWGAYTECRARPTDFDGDGSLYGTDCDDADPDVRPTSTAPCGRFACGSAMGMTTFLPGTRTCMGPGWSECARPMGCAEPTGSTLCEPFAFVNEERDCATMGCPAVPMYQTRSCEPAPPPAMTASWGMWSACMPRFFPPPPPGGGGCGFAPTEVAEETCGACGEGVRYTICDGATCAPSLTSCLGRRCTPGTRVPSTSGCPAGQVRYQECDAECNLGAPGACMEGSTGLDVMFLFDVSGSHGAGLDAVRRALPETVLEPLLGDPSIAAGISYFSDYPLGSHGSPPDVPFGGLLEPTAGDAGAVGDALDRVMLLSGGDQGEALIEALAILGGRDPHPTAMPLLDCSAERTAGGCWRARSTPVIVVVTEEAHHELPESRAFGLSPYEPVVMPRPPAWDEVRDLLSGLGARLVFVTPEVSLGALDPALQFEAMATDIGQDPATAVVRYSPAAPEAGVADLLDRVRSFAP